MLVISRAHGLRVSLTFTGASCLLNRRCRGVGLPAQKQERGRRLTLYARVTVFIRALHNVCYLSRLLTVCPFGMRGRFLFAESPVQGVRVSATLITSALHGACRVLCSLTVCVRVCVCVRARVCMSL